MPHRVTEFFRSHSNSLEITSDRSKSARRSSSSKTKRPSLIERKTSSSGSSLISAEDARNMVSDGKRLSFPGRLSSPRNSSTKVTLQQQSTLSFVIESPPLVSYGPVSSSSGALLSGQIKLTVHEESLSVETFKMRLNLEVTRKKPFHAHCQECQHQKDTMKEWVFLPVPTVLQKGEHTFPFSQLIGGHLPATMKGSLSAIDYVLRATLCPSTGEPVKLARNIVLKRAIYPSDASRNSIRIFPPTNLTANCQLPPVIYPIGESVVGMRMDGVVKRNPDSKTQHQWKLKRVVWRLDETQKVISPACAKHAAKLGNVEEGKKGIAHQDVRTIGTEEVKTGWKTDYSTPDGSIELEFPFSIRPDSKAICDMKALDGTEVSHVLIVEMIVAEEFAPLKKLTQVTPTGAARVLRMHFNVILTERSGLGISWDEEQPPLYENVPASPPGYGAMLPYEGEPIPAYDDLSPLDSSVPVTQGVAALALVSSNGEGSSTRRLSISDLQHDV